MFTVSTSSRRERAMDIDPRTTVVSPDDVVVLLIGMRVNRWRAVRHWLPVAAAMPRMLRELQRADLGLLEARTYVSGRVVLVVQYWRSFEELEAYARSADSEHLPAWRAYNRRTRTSDAVGIYHETYVVPASARETIYAHMPPHGLAKALGSAPLTRDRGSARLRLAAVRTAGAPGPRAATGAPAPAGSRA